MFFVYNIIETSCFFVLEKKITDPFCRPLVLIETPEPPLSFKNPSLSSTLLFFINKW